MKHLSAAILALAISVVPSLADEWRTSSSLIGDSKYKNGFSQYEHVNPAAPKGGTLNSSAFGTFDSFNPFIVRGTAAAGLTYTGGLLHDTLFQQSVDEAGAGHPQIADAYKFPADYSSATYRINPKARFHDGSAVSAADVIWSFEVLKENSPFFSKYYSDVAAAAESAPGEVTFTFAKAGNRELPHIMGDLPVLSKAWWTGTDAKGAKRDIAQPTLEIPLGNGPYKITSFKPGAEIVWERVADYWAADLPVNRGRHNFGRRRYVYFLDANAQWQAFTKGGYEDLRLEGRSQKWATEYTFPAFTSGDVIKQEFAQTSGESMQGFVMNLRRPQFADRKVRQALTLAFDFESMNRTLFYGLYTRTDSFFEGGPLASSGLPEGKELEILETVRGKVPAEVFTTPFVLPVTDTPDKQRESLRAAFALFKEAGYETRGGALVNASSGEPFKITFLGDDPTDERITGPFIETLKRLGIDAKLDVVDPQQYVSRVENFDFDMLTANFAQSQSPGNEQREYFSSAAAAAPGSRNLFGVKDEAVDALVERVIFATDRDDLIAATKALDRVLLWNFLIVPQWHNPAIWTARWNKFGIPAKQPAYLGIDVDSWWIDPAKEAALDAKYKTGN